MPHDVYPIASAPTARKSSAVERINALGELAGGIAHDFRNVLAVISSAIRLAERHQGGSREAGEYLAAAREGVERGIRLTSRLLALGKPRAPDLHPESPVQLVRELLPFLKYGAGPQARVRVELDPTAVNCRVDPPLFNAALLNLVVNARDAMPDGGEIVIRSEIVPAPADVTGARNASDFLRIRVSDTGEGMSQEVAAHIFDPWFTTKGDTGTGLGLPQVHRFMTSVGGHIRVSSEPAKGTAFDLYFPLEEREATDRTLACQLDRWTNEGGAPEPARAGPVDRLVAAAPIRIDGGIERPCRSF